MINLIKPKIIDYPDKTPVSGDGSYLYNELPSDRRFEELIYSIYKQKIENEENWNNLFDDIFLTTASSDYGEDCILYKNGRAAGVIQCKKYSENVDKPEVAKEVIKYLLYTIIDKSLMPDPVNFHYYFIVSKGFTKPAIELIENFSEAIFKEDKIEKWFNDLKKKYSATFRNINFEKIKSELFSKFRSIKINKKVPQDLDIELTKDYNKQVLVLFFNIKMVTDNALIKDSTNEILSRINAIPEMLANINLTEEEIIKKFNIASIQLADWKDDLSNVSNSHIPRNETVKVLNWLNNKLQKEKEPILMLTGNPGFGKSVILKDTLIELQKKKIPVIGIKADRYPAESVKHFNELTNLKFPLEQLTELLLKNNKQVVVLIDQIDSLSTSVTSRRTYLDVYRQLIDNILLIIKDKPEFLKNKIRIVIAIREFDLTYNFEFSYFKKFEKVDVEKLSGKQIEPIIEKLNLKINSLSEQLVDLIKIPSYLEILCKTYNSKTNISRINTAIDLMDELWVQTTTGSNSSLIESTLYNIIHVLRKLNTLSVDVKELRECDNMILAKLKNDGLVLITQNQLQFFHQTFYDYSFARSFIHTGQSIEQYIQNEYQSIYIRPTLKTMIAYLRQTHFKKYIEITRNILFSKKYRFHIQLLIIQELGFIQNPEIDEIDLVANKLIKCKQFFLPFLESVIGNKWFPILVDNQILDKLIYPQSTKFKLFGLIKPKKQNVQLSIPEENLKLNIWASIIRKAFKTNRVKAINYLHQLKRFPNDSQTIRWILLGLNTWDYPLSFIVFEKYADNIKEDFYHRLHVIEDAIPYNFDWCVTQLKIVLAKEPEIDPSQSSIKEHQLCNILNSLSKVNKEKFFEFGIELINNNISNHHPIDGEDEYYRYDHIYGSFMLNKEYIDDEDKKLVQLVF